MIRFRFKEEAPTIDDEQLIEAVSTRPFLYDTKHRDYRNLPVRVTAWSTIAKEINTPDQNVVQKRWKVLREKFSVAYRKQELEGVEPKWNFYEKLTFLIPFVNLKADKKQTFFEPLPEERDIPKSPFDEHLLIQLIKAKPALYDKKHHDFRSTFERRKAWEHIASKANWDVETLQKRWRVMRDRFVRDLRRSQSIDTDSGQVHCSPFFRDMLFLAQHVKSRKYEIDAQIDDNNEPTWNDQNSLDETESDHQLNDQISVCSDNNEQQFVQFIEESDGVQENIAYEEVYENPVEESNVSFEFIEEMDEHIAVTEPEITSPDKEVHESHLEESFEYQDDRIAANKRRNSTELDHEPKIRRKVDSESSTRANEDVTNKDEDIAFGNTIGCMLKKIPPHLKTAVKLKLLQSLAEFEAQHKLH